MRIGKYHPWMRDDQIVAQWRDAKDRTAQVKILAQLNDVPRSVIEEILIAHGCEITRKKQPARSVVKKSWTEAEDARLKELHGEGCSYEEIADALGRTFAAMKFRISEQKRKEKEKEMNGRGWTSDEVAFMLERRKQGVDVRHIAAEMGRTVPAINTKLKKLREEGKKIAAEIEAEERAGDPGSHDSQCAAQDDTKEMLVDKIIRIVQDYKKAAEAVGSATEIKITADEKHVTIVGTGGEVVFHMQETVITN